MFVTPLEVEENALPFPETKLRLEKVDSLMVVTVTEPVIGRIITTEEVMVVEDEEATVSD